MKIKSTVLFISLVMAAFTIMAQGVKITKSQDVQERDNKQYYIHTVTKGQTLYSIAKAYNVSIDEIYFENPDAKYGLQIGQQLWIPTINKETEINKEVSTASFDYFYHIAKENERFRNIASIYGIPEKYIRLANPGLTEPLKAGEYVKIPAESAFAVLDGGQPNITQASGKNSNNQNVSFNPNIKVKENYRHVVAQGETLFGIAKKYQISIDDLKSVNPGLSTIRQGDRLRIPDYAVVSGNGKQAMAASANTTVVAKKKPQQTKSDIYYKYTVHNGDNLYKIARAYGVSLEELHKANPKLRGTNLIKGQIIYIPKLKTRPHYIYYKVPESTKLRKVAKLFGLSKRTVKNSNPGIKNRVYANQMIKIPGGEKAVLLSAKPETKPTDNEVVVEKPKPSQCQPSPYRGKVVKVALMIPLFLEEMHNIDYEEFQSTYRATFKPFRFVEFLEGASIALDSLKALGYNIELNVYDVDSKITKTTKVLQKPEIKNMDLIIGPFYSKSFNQVAFFAENFNIPVVNPFSQREEILAKYENIIKVKPAISSQIPLLKELIRKKYPNHKVFFITRSAYKDADLVTRFKSGLTEAIPATVKLSNIDINNVSIEVDNRLSEDDEPLSPYYNLEGKPIDPPVVEADLYDSTNFNNRPVFINYMVDTVNPVLNNASVIRKNLVIIYGYDKPYIMDVINRLNRVRDTFDIEIVGIPLWENIKKMDYTLLNNLNLTYFTSKHINYNNAQTKNFIAKFREKYSTEPNYYGYEGFDITLFFVKTLADYNRNFLKCLPEQKARTFNNGFKFMRTGKNNRDFENTMWNIIQMQNYKTIRLPESDLIPMESAGKY